MPDIPFRRRDPLKLELYYSIFCPRCLYAGRSLKKLRKEYPELEIETVEISLNLSRARREKIRTIPTLKMGDDSLSGFLLTPDRIRSFLAERGLESSS